MAFGKILQYQVPMPKETSNLLRLRGDVADEVDLGRMLIAAYSCASQRSRIRPAVRKAAPFSIPRNID